MPEPDLDLTDQLTRMIEELSQPAVPAADTLSDLPVVPPMAPLRSLASQKYKSMRRWRRIFAIALLVPLVIASTMIGIHGIAFFVFRSAGTGESPDFAGSSALTENQGPGQPNAPKAVEATVKAGAAKARAPDLVALSPAVKLTIPAARHDTWASIAELRNGSWAIVSAGTQYATVAADTVTSFNANRARYLSQWIILPVHPE
jgi:hypothetical protein